jgi:hypothetical protein
MGAVHVGETWRIRLVDEFLVVKVTEAGETPDWWKCLELETGAEVTIPERWFIERLDEEP